MDIYDDDDELMIYNGYIYIYIIIIIVIIIILNYS